MSAANALLAPEATLGAVLLVGALGALLAMDEVAVAQTWFGQPLPAALVTGWLLGDPGIGLAVGLPLQVALLGNLPVGQTFTGEPTSAVVAVVGGVVLAGRDAAAPWAQGTSQEAALLGWVLTLAVLFSALGHWVVQAERRACVQWMLLGHRTLRDGDLGRIEGLHLRGLLATLLRGLLFTVLFLLVSLRLALPAFDLLPAAAVPLLALVPWLLPALGLGALLGRFGLRRYWPWVLGGASLPLLAVLADRLGR